MEQKNEKVIQSVSRAISIIRCFEYNEELGVTDISKMINLHKSTTFGLISTLQINGLLEKNEDTSKYRLGIELFRLGTLVNSNLRKIAIPYLEKLVRIYHETVNLVTLDNDSVVYLEKVEGTHSMFINTLVGGRLPLYCTAVGKVILAGLSDSDLINKIDKITFKKFTDKTILNKETLLKSIMNTRENGYAEDSEELEMGLTCVAAPIYNHLGISFAAISISTPIYRMNEEFKNKIVKTLREMTQIISGKIGYTENIMKYQTRL